MLSKSFSRREKILLLVLVVLLLCSLYALCVSRPVTNGIIKANAEIEDCVMTSSILEARLQKLEAMKNELEEQKNGESELAEVPEYDNLQNIIAFLNGVLGTAQDYTINFGSITMNEEGTIAKRAVSISFKADSYESAKAAVEKLEGYKYINRITNLVISPLDKDLDIMSGPVSVTLTIDFFERLPAAK